MTYTVSGGALNSTQSNFLSFRVCDYMLKIFLFSHEHYACDAIGTMLMREVVRLMFGPRTLFYTNVLTNGGLMGFTDWVVQKAFEKTDESRQKIDWARTGNCPYLYYFSVSYTRI